MALLPLANISVARIRHPAERFALHQRIRAVVQSIDAPTIYEVPILMQSQGLDVTILKKMGLPVGDTPGLGPWRAFLERRHKAEETAPLHIALVGKYDLQDAYKSIREALSQAGTYNDRKVSVDFVNSEKLTDENVAEALKGMAGVLIGPGFGERGVAGKFVAIKYARTHDIPTFGICLGMQCIAIEFARNVLGYADANSREMDEKTPHNVIDIMEEFGDECKRRHGKRIIYPSDEWYLKAGRPIPEPEFYEDYDQLENGVGMMSLFREEFLAELEKPHRIYGTKKMDVVTGTMAAPLITEMMDELRRQYPMIEVKVHPIKNNFFGGNVGVAGLVTATDIIAQCEGRLSSGTLGVPAVMLREEKDTFLDDMTIEQLGQRLGVKVEVLPTSGGDEAKALLRSGLHIARRRRP